MGVPIDVYTLEKTFLVTQKLNDQNKGQIVIYVLESTIGLNGELMMSSTLYGARLHGPTKWRSLLRVWRTGDPCRVPIGDP